MLIALRSGLEQGGDYKLNYGWLDPGSRVRRHPHGAAEGGDQWYEVVAQVRPKNRLYFEVRGGELWEINVLTRLTS